MTKHWTVVFYLSSYICSRTVTCFGPKKSGKSSKGYTLFYKQPHFRVKPRVAIKIPKMRLKVAMKLLSILGIEAEGC